MPRDQLVSAVFGRKAILLTSKEPREHADRVLGICKQMFLKGFPEAPRLDFALEKEEKARILWLLT